MTKTLLNGGKVLVQAFKKQHGEVAATMSKSTQKRAAASIAARRLLNKVLQVRQYQAGTLLKAVRSITNMDISEMSDFGNGSHCSHSEPYFYESAYQFSERPDTMSVDYSGVCRPFGESIDCEEGEHKSWKCSSKCKSLSGSEIDTIINFRSIFDKSMLEIRKCLDACDYCPNNRYTNPCGVQLMGHSLVCFTGNECKSSLRILRAASVHYAVLRSFLLKVYSALSSHKCVAMLDEALKMGDCSSLMESMEITLEDLFSNKVLTSHETDIKSVLRKPSLEKDIQIKYAKVMATYSKELEDYPQNPCCSCNMLFRRKQGTKVRFADQLGVVWPELKKFISKDDPKASKKTLFMCNYCKSSLRANRMPPRCVLNGLHTIPVPIELRKLDDLGKQLIQRAKSFQTVVRLGTYTKKVPVYNSLKACKGNIFYLPLPLSKTMETIDAVEGSLANPELYILVNGKPTKSNVVWRSLIKIEHVKAAINKLRECNWLYREVSEESIDSAAKDVIEAVSNTSSTMLEKASKSDIAGLQCYTIKNLNDKVSTEDDIEQYRMLSIKEDALDERQRHLDVMCFPVLFPDGNFGKYHPRKVGVSHSEYIKSRLWNKDSRFRKDPQYVFYLLKQKESRELAAGVFTLMKTSRTTAISVTSLLQQVQTSSEHLERNLSTMFQSVRGSKQYWFQRRGELLCMLRELGPQSLFVTFSCAEYESPDITEYLRIVNNVDKRYNIAKLCTEDPISVSRQFSHKFHAFFQTMIVKGQVLGQVDNYYWKKEYQARGAPHYHVVLWIRGAPIIGESDPDTVLDWINERITCHIPDKENNPELHNMVTRYQMHKCSNYCRRKKKKGKIYVTRCRFNFPRQEREKAVIHNVESNLKKFQKVYEIARTASEVRVNDYNPVLLLNWGANMDIQFIGDKNMVVSTYVSGYVTKHESGHLQDQFEQITDSKSICSRLFSIGRQLLKSRVCGLYEAADLLCGDSLCEKSATVQWVDTRVPHKRFRRVRNHTDLLQLESVDPGSENIFLDNYLSTYYPGRPDHLEDLCLHDFVANYNWYEKDANGDRTYRKLTKPRLVNHKVLDPNKPEQREGYFYSLILLFVPFRDESSLVRDDETAEDAFNRLLPDSDDCSAYHERLQAMLNAHATVRSINEARKADFVVEEESEEEDGMQVLGEAKSAMQDLQDINANPPETTLTLQERVEMLNADQKRVFDKISNHLRHQKEHEDKKCQCSNLKPLTMFVSGVGGTGKSFLIEAVKAMADSIWVSDSLKCAVTAPTGLASFNVGGVTIHMLVLLPVEHEGKEAGYWTLPKTSQKVMRTTLKSLKLLIIDEVSMVSSLNLTYIHMRLQELFGGDEWFGDKNVLFVGDLLQLAPVNGRPVFEKMCKTTIVHKLGCAGSVNIWKDCVTYEELTINERQKKDGDYSSLLNSVRLGNVSEEIIATLQDRVITVTVAEKYSELQNTGCTPVCLLPTKKQCAEINDQMLGLLESEVHVIPCKDEVDETKGKEGWNERAAKHLEKLNQNCQNTAGLEPVLKLAVGARVMLRRNINVKAGLVNGTLGSIVEIHKKRVYIKFDHMDEPCAIEQVKGRFMVMKNYYVYRTQFPLMLAYAVTIHKCQGLSLDCAIVDLSDKVFAEGMAYVALSRVRSIEGLHLIELDPNSIRVSLKCLEEINRLRHLYRKDLGLYKLPTLSRMRKRKLTGTCGEGEPPLKKACNKKKPAKKNKPHSKKPTALDSDKLKKVSNNASCQNRVWPFQFHCVGEVWQRSACQALGLQFHKANGVGPGNRDMPLTRPDMRKIKKIQGDGNCMFRSLSCVMTGSQDQHHAIRAKIVEHFSRIGPLMLGHIKSRSGYNHCQSVDEYIQKSQMDKNGTWGTDLELLCFAHLTNTCVFSYSRELSNWNRYGPHNVDRTIPIDVKARSVYLFHPFNHYDLVGSTVKVPSSSNPGDKRSKPPYPAGSARSRVWEELRFHSVDQQWQSDKCNLLGLPFHSTNGVDRGGPNVALTMPSVIKSIHGDGNCLFRCFSYVITGSEQHHMAVRTALIAHMHLYPNIVTTLSTVPSVDAYIRSTGMDRFSTWGTDHEVRGLCHMLNTPVFVYKPPNWVRMTPELIEPTLYSLDSDPSIYIVNEREHFTVVLSTMHLV